LFTTLQSVLSIICTVTYKKLKHSGESHTGAFYLRYVIKFSAGNHTEKTSGVSILVHVTPTQSTLSHDRIKFNLPLS